MTDPFVSLKDAPRLLMEARLKPLQGQRFQPTGFPDLGPARYKAYTSATESAEMVLVESPQSVANHLETVCWDKAKGQLVSELAGMPYVRVTRPDKTPLTNSILEAHRLNSPYILSGKENPIVTMLKNDVVGGLAGPVDIGKLARAVFKYDSNAVLHGVFFANKENKEELAGGRLRMPRLISGFIEAIDVLDAASGGVKNDHVDPSGDTALGFGNVPFHRSEFTAKQLVAYFNLDLAQLRGYALGESAETFMIALALFKIQRFLKTRLHLRTACDLDVDGGLTVTRPAEFKLPDETTIEGILKESLASCRKAKLFADEPVTTVVYEEKKKKKDSDQKEEA